MQWAWNVFWYLKGSYDDAKKNIIVFWTTVRSAVFPMIVKPCEQNWETILKAQETFAGVLSWLADWHVTIF